MILVLARLIELITAESSSTALMGARVLSVSIT